MKILGIAAVLSVVAPAAPAFAASLITDGDFSQYTVSDVTAANPGSLNLRSGSNYVYIGGTVCGTGTLCSGGGAGVWTYDYGTGENSQGNGGAGLVQYPNPSSGFQGPPSPNAPNNTYAFLQQTGVLAQLFSSPVTGPATISFDVASRINGGNNGTPSGVEEFEVVLNGAVVDTYTTTQAQAFTLVTLTAVGDLVSGANLNQLKFVGLTDTPDETAFLTNISLTPNATPLPTTWLMMLGGLVGLGFFAYRGSKLGSAAIPA